MLEMVSIVGVEGEARKSTLILEKGGALRVLGVLPHNYAFKPSTAEDAEKLAKHLLSWPK
jgi:hypothetical protein